MQNLKNNSQCFGRFTLYESGHSDYYDFKFTNSSTGEIIGFRKFLSEVVNTNLRSFFKFDFTTYFKDAEIGQYTYEVKNYFGEIIEVGSARVKGVELVKNVSYGAQIKNNVYNG